MQIAPVRAAAGTPAVLASQTIALRSSALPGGGTMLQHTEREYRLAGAREGLDTFASVADAYRSAAALSAGEMPGVAVVKFRGGYRIHDVHASSRSYTSISTDSPLYPPTTQLIRKSSVPFAAGNIRTGAGNDYSPALVRDAALVALVDGSRSFVPATETWAGQPRLVERATPSA